MNYQAISKPLPYPMGAEYVKNYIFSSNECISEKTIVFFNSENGNGICYKITKNDDKDSFKVEVKTEQRNQYTRNGNQFYTNYHYIGDITEKSFKPSSESSFKNTSIEVQSLVYVIKLLKKGQTPNNLHFSTRFQPSLRLMEEIGVVITEEIRREDRAKVVMMLMARKSINQSRWWKTR